MIIQGTHRAYMGADTQIEAFVRNDAGPVDLSGAEPIMARVYVGKGKEVAGFTVTGDAEGRITFVVGAETARQRLRPGVFDLRVESGGRVVYTAILEMV